MRQKGFTLLELIIVTVFLVIIGTIFFVQKRDLEVANRDSQRKTAINSLYYNLEDVYFAQHKSYPQTLTSDQLKGADPGDDKHPGDFKDPAGKRIGEEGSNYAYTPKDCDGNKCKSYTLTADLEAEADYTKESRNK